MTHFLIWDIGPFVGAAMAFLVWPLGSWIADFIATSRRRAK